MTIKSATSAFTTDKSEAIVFINVESLIPQTIIRQLEIAFPETTGRYSLFCFGGYKKFQTWICMDTEYYLSKKWFDDHEEQLSNLSKDDTIGSVVYKDVTQNLEEIIGKLKRIEENIGDNTSAFFDVQTVKNKILNLVCQLKH